MSNPTVPGFVDEWDEYIARPLNQWDEYIADLVEEARRGIVAPGEQRTRLMGLAQRIGLLTSDGFVAVDLIGEVQQERRAALLRAMRDLAAMLPYE